MFLVALIIKHFVCDFPLQHKYQYLNKGRYGHLGGILHACLHGLGTLYVSYCFNAPLWYALVDVLVHYHIDWAKVRISKHYSLTATNSEYFWWLLGLDQMLHYLTYAWMIST